MRVIGLVLAAICALGAPLAAQDAPVLRGTLRDSTGRALENVEVSYKNVSTRTDSAGNFRLTPVPTGRITVRFTKGRSVIGELEANVTTDTTSAVEIKALVDRAVTRTFAGVVVDSSGAPVRGASVEVIPELAEARTDSLGRFAITGMPAKRHLVRVRRVGYPPLFLSIDLSDNVSRSARIVMRQFAGQNLGLVVVHANRPVGRMAGFMQRAEKRTGWGKIFTAADIARSNPISTSDLFRTTAGVRVAQDHFGRGVLLGRGGCIMALSINGFSTPQQSGVGIDDMVSTLDLAGAEVYNGMAGVPAELTLGPPNECGTVALWTR